MKILLILLLLLSDLALAKDIEYIGTIGDRVILKIKEKTLVTKVGKTILKTDLKISRIFRQGTKIKVQLSNGKVLGTHNPVLGEFKKLPNQLEDEEVKNLLRNIHKEKIKELEKNEEDMETRNSSSEEGKDERSSEINEDNKES